VYNIALRTHHEEKLEALRNVVINVAINAAKPTNVEDDATLIFTNFIDTFTHWHIKIFVHLDETSQVINDFRASGKHFSTNALEKVLNDFPELKEDSDIAVQVIKDLQNRG
jgi:inosine/xanthosine triphosphate pyrophosphatase family protein